MQTVPRLRSQASPTSSLAEEASETLAGWEPSLAEARSSGRHLSQILVQSAGRSVLRENRELPKRHPQGVVQEDGRD